MAKRYHDICMGHRVVGHEGKCKHLHGHNYRFTFSCESAGGVDSIGRVIDFSVIKTTLCQWLEDNWDHKMLLWEEDPYIYDLMLLDPSGVVKVSFNPTAENIGLYLIHEVSPNLLPTGIQLVSVEIEETRKCSATVSL